MQLSGLARSVVGAAAAFVMIVGVPGCSSSEDGARNGAAGFGATQGPASGDLLAYGVIERDGKPVKNARIALALWHPDPKTGDEVQDEYGGLGFETDGDGRYEVRLDPDTLDTTYYADEQRDTLNVELHVYAGDQMALWNVGLSLVGDPGVWRSDEGSGTSGSVERIDIDFGTRQLTTFGSDGTLQKHDAPIIGG